MSTSSPSQCWLFARIATFIFIFTALLQVLCVVSCWVSRHPVVAGVLVEKNNTVKINAALAAAQVELDALKKAAQLAAQAKTPPTA